MSLIYIQFGIGPSLQQIFQSLKEKPNVHCWHAGSVHVASNAATAGRPTEYISIMTQQVVAHEWSIATIVNGPEISRKNKNLEFPFYTLDQSAFWTKLTYASQCVRE